MLFYLRILFMYLFHLPLYALLSNTIGLLVSFVMRWKFGFPNVEEFAELEHINPITKEEVEKLNQSLEGEGQDKAKFYGMKYFSTKSRDDWRYLFENFVDTINFKFIRGHDNESLSFSGDMYSGIILAIAQAEKLDHITPYQKEVLAKVFVNICFGGFIPFRQPHDDLSRGYLGTPAICNGMAMSVLSILKMGARLNTGVMSWNLYLLYYLFFTFSLLPLGIGCFDRYLWWWKIICPFSYSTHSDMVLYKACDIIKIPFAEKGMDYIYKYHGSYNIDVQVLSGKYNKGFVLRHLKNLLDSRSREYVNDETAKYFSLKGFTLVAYLKKLTISNTCPTYTWEKGGLTRGSKNSNKSNFDIVFPWNNTNQ